jgi:Tol biopolymer transport system component
MGRGPGDSVERDLSWFDWSTIPRLSSDARTLVFSEQGDGGGADYSVYMRTMDGGPAVRLGAGSSFGISPDGKWALAVRLNPAPAQYMLLPTGAGEARVLTHDDLWHNSGEFTPDGSAIAFEGFAPQRGSRMYRQDLSGGAARPLTPEGVIGKVSPDGKLVPFDGKLYPTDGGAPRAIPGIEPADNVVGWTADSRELFLRQLPASGDQRIFRLDVGSGKRTLLFEIPRVHGGGAPGPWFAITPDGASYAYSYNVSQADLYRITGLK